MKNKKQRKLQEKMMKSKGCINLLDGPAAETSK
jgi:hypothetical protein